MKQKEEEPFTLIHSVIYLCPIILSEITKLKKKEDPFTLNVMFLLIANIHFKTIYENKTMEQKQVEPYFEKMFNQKHLGIFLSIIQPYTDKILRIKELGCCFLIKVKIIRIHH